MSIAEIDDLDREMMGELDRFVASGMKNKWLQTRHMEIYVRRARRIFKDVSRDFITTLDLSNIGVEPPYQRKGRFTKFLAYAENLVCTNADFGAVYVENVLNPRLLHFLLRRKYGYSENFGGIYSLYKTTAALQEESSGQFVGKTAIVTQLDASYGGE